MADPAPASVPTRLNIGSGRLWDEASINIDISQAAGPDILVDVSRPDLLGMRFPTHRFGTVELAAGAFDHITASHVLEHVPNLVGAMTNCLGLLRDGGIMAISVPYELSYGAWQDPTHLRAFNERSWLYYTDWFWQLGWTESRFDIVDTHLVLSPSGQRLQKQGIKPEELRVRWRAVDELRIELRKRPLTPQEVAAGHQISHPHLKRFPALAIPATAAAPRPRPVDQAHYLELLSAWLEERLPGRDLDRLRDAADGLLAGAVTGDFLAAGDDAATLGAMLAGVRRAAGTADRTWIAVEGTEDTARAALERFRLLDERTVVVAGPYGDSLPLAPIDRVALLAVGGGGDVLARVLPAVFDRVADGGLVMVEAAARATLEYFLARRAIPGPAPVEAGGWLIWERPRP